MCGGSNYKKMGWLWLMCCSAMLLVACDSNTSTVTSPTLATSSNSGSGQSISLTNGVAANSGFKIDTLLADFTLKYKTSGLNAARQFAHDIGLLDDSNQLHFGLTLVNQSLLPAVQTRINQLGGQIFEQYQEHLGVAVSLDVFDKFQQQTSNPDFWHILADLPQVRELKVLPRPPLTQVATAPDPNQGVGITGANLWQQRGFRGQNIKIGIIDGGFKGYKNFLGTAALPPASGVTFKSFLFGGSAEGGEEHGVAVAEIVHSMAPDAQLILTPIEDEIGFAKAVDYLLENHVKIIQASLGWGGLWPGDGSGLMDSKLNQARQQGVLPIVSAGNYGQGHYMGDLNPDGGNYNQFEAGNNVLKLTAETDSAWVALRWDENWAAPSTNLDLYILDGTKQIIGTSRNVQGSNSQKPPTELVPFRTTPNQTYYIQVRLVGKAATTKLHFHLFAYNAPLENSTPVQSLATPADAAGAISVGATYWNDDKVEGYSSQGPTQDGRLKPELMAPTGVDSIVYGRYKQVFGGTSAAAPQVSGVAAIVWSALPSLTADGVARYLERNAAALGGGGRQPTTGFGRLRLGSTGAVGTGEAALTGPVPAGPAFRDDFTKWQSGLPDDILAYYGQTAETTPAYFMQVSQSGWLGWNVYNQADYTQFRADFVVTPPAQSGAFYGLVFWQQAADSYHVLLVSGNQYALLQRSGAGWRPLINWTGNAALQPNSPHQRISLEATSTYISIMADDILLQTVILDTKNPPKIGGKLGFACGKFSLETDLAPINPGPIQRENTVVSFNSLVIVPLT